MAKIFPALLPACRQAGNNAGKRLPQKGNGVTHFPSGATFFPHCYNNVGKILAVNYYGQNVFLMESNIP